jgi:hypothetical protein
VVKHIVTAYSEDNTEFSEVLHTVKILTDLSAPMEPVCQMKQQQKKLLFLLLLASHYPSTSTTHKKLQSNDENTDKDKKAHKSFNILTICL